MAVEDTDRVEVPEDWRQVTPAQALRELDYRAHELGRLSSALSDVQRRLAPLDDQYDQFVMDFEVGLWTKHENGDMKRWPSDAMRLKLAHKASDPELLGKRKALQLSRDRLRKRISDLRIEVDALRSVLSGLKAEMEATR
jgi:hypothetical protein